MVGRKNWSKDSAKGTKGWIQRYGSKRGVSRRSYNRAEKTAETAVRQAGKRACQEIH